MKFTSIKLVLNTQLENYFFVIHIHLDSKTLRDKCFNENSIIHNIPNIFDIRYANASEQQNKNNIILIILVYCKTDTRIN